MQPPPPPADPSAPQTMEETVDDVEREMAEENARKRDIFLAMANGFSAAEKAVAASKHLATFFEPESDDWRHSHYLAEFCNEIAASLQNTDKTIQELSPELVPELYSREGDELFAICSNLNSAAVILAKVPLTLRRLEPRKRKHVFRKLNKIPLAKNTGHIAKHESIYTEALNDAMQASDVVDSAVNSFFSFVTYIINARMAAMYRFVVFISHAGEDKETLALPIWRRLRDEGITAFLDREELRAGENANEAMQSAMTTAPIGLFILSTEFAAKRWTMKELETFLEREQEANSLGQAPPLLIPVFYRFGLNSWADQNLFTKSEFAKWGFLERVDAGETSIKRVRESLRVLSRHTGIENVLGATNESSHAMSMLRDEVAGMVVQKIVDTARDHQFELRPPEGEEDGTNGDWQPAPTGPASVNEAGLPIRGPSWPAEEEIKARIQRLHRRVKSRGSSDSSEDPLAGRYTRLGQYAVGNSSGAGASTSNSTRLEIPSYLRLPWLEGSSKGNAGTSSSGQVIAQSEVPPSIADKELMARVQKLQEDIQKREDPS